MMPHMIYWAARHFWSSEVNRDAVERLAPVAGETIVDIGSGLGPASLDIAARIGPSGVVIAVDPSRTMRCVLRARRALGRFALPVRQVDATAESLPSADGSVDGIVGLNVMHHFDDPHAAARELARALRPGGRVLLVDEDFGDARHSAQSGSHHHHGPELHSPADIAAMLTDAGFQATDARHERVGGEPALVVTGLR